MWFELSTISGLFISYVLILSVGITMFSKLFQLLILFFLNDLTSSTLIKNWETFKTIPPGPQYLTPHYLFWCYQIRPAYFSWWFCNTSQLVLSVQKVIPWLWFFLKILLPGIFIEVATQNVHSWTTKKLVPFTVKSCISDCHDASWLSKCPSKTGGD